jgi:hypothetical protein
MMKKEDNQDYEKPPRPKVGDVHEVQIESAASALAPLTGEELQEWKESSSLFYRPFMMES